MGTVAKLAWMERVGTVLATITTGNGYRTTVTTVEPVIRTWEEVGRNQLPIIGYGIESTVAEAWEGGGQFHCKSKLNVVAHVGEASASAALTALCNLEDDIIAALMADQTLDSNTIDIRWVSTVDDVQDPHAANTQRGGRGSMVVEFEVLWERSTARTP